MEDSLEAVTAAELKYDTRVRLDTQKAWFLGRSSVVFFCWGLFREKQTL